jgi:4-amino-4-deoxy-L-arabinose transferase-like glycosyltransferase
MGSGATGFFHWMLTAVRQGVLPLLLILGVMFSLMLGSAWNDSAIYDEVSHIPSGFGYVTQLDTRLNPQHPPLMKALAALSAQLFVHPVFPTDTAAWKSANEWVLGKIFLYESGNDPDRIVFWARIPMMLTTLSLGALLFLFARRRYGSDVAVLTLVLFAFSPTFLAQGRYVTTDVGVSLGFFIGIVTYVGFLEESYWKNVFLSGLALGFAELTKFSAMLLIPVDAVLLSVWILSSPPQRRRAARRLASRTFIVGLIGLSVIWVAYALFSWNYPLVENYRVAGRFFSRHHSASLLMARLITFRLTRPIDNFLVGLLAVLHYTASGHDTPTYFLGTTSMRTSRLYFPVLYLFKEPLALHVLTLLALCYATGRSIQIATKDRGAAIVTRLRRWIQEHFFEFGALTFISLYWVVALLSPLHIGVRHVMPTFPFIYLLVSREVGEWLEAPAASTPDGNEHSSRFCLPRVFKVTLVGGLALWLVVSTVTSFPYFLSYYNELGGGTRNGYKVAVDSNYDWGQDLIRLRDYVVHNHIHEVKVDYFGRASPEYYLGSAFVPWNASKGPAHGWFAVSATELEDSLGARRASGGHAAGYGWLERYKPVARAGCSIFVYHLP